MISDSEFKENQFSDTQQVAASIGVQAQLKLAKVSTDDKRSRAWRITLSRLDRNDGHAPLVDNAPPTSPIPIFQSQSYNYAAGADQQSVFASSVPPRRSNPVFGAQTPTNGAVVDPVFVQIAWGMSQGRVNRLIAHWPAQGASIVVEGAVVEVFGGVATRSATLGSPAITFAEFPNLAAQITPIVGLASADAGELSIQQRVNLPFTTTGPAARVNTASQIIQGAPGSPGFVNGNMMGSAVYGTQPFTAWNADIVSRDGRTPRQVVLFTAATAPQFELRDNQAPDASGAFVAAPGSVGVVYRTDGVTGVQTIAAWNALLNSSALVQVASVSGTQGNLLFAGYSAPPSGTVPPASTGRAVFDIGAPSQGGAVYVPDFARRVRVQAVRQFTNFAGINLRTPFPGPLPLQLVWYDDQGLVVDAQLQGLSFDSTNGFPIPIPVDWQPVPARAVMLGVYPAQDGQSLATDQALIHWRIAP